MGRWESTSLIIGNMRLKASCDRVDCYPEWLSMREAPPRSVSTIDPRGWIRPPYRECEHCGAQDGVGLLMVSGTAVVRRCRSCMRDSLEHLPAPPRPRVLYLDQWALSSLAKARFPQTRERFASEHDRRAGAGAWPRLLARIERLVKAALLVCPPSSIHQAESSLDTRLWHALRRVHVYLSGDARLLDHAVVKRHQLYASFCAWLDGVEPVFPGRDDVLTIRKGWPDLLQVTSSYRPEPAEVESLRARRRSRGGRLQRHVEKWASEKPRTFDERREEQLAAYGPSFLPVLPLSDLYALTSRALLDRSLPSEQTSVEVERFLRAELPGQTPFARLASDVFASIGWLAERSQCPKVDDGMIDDIQAFAAYAPFCDAFTVDRRFAHVLHQSPMRDRLPSNTAIISSNALDRLESWLFDAETDAPAGHFDLISRVYGAGWLEPYAGILDPPGR
jgi:hypothetical protein